MKDWTLNETNVSEPINVKITWAAFLTMVIVFVGAPPIVLAEFAQYKDRVFVTHMSSYFSGFTVLMFLIISWCFWTLMHNERKRSIQRGSQIIVQTAANERAVGGLYAMGLIGLTCVLPTMVTYLLSAGQPAMAVFGVTIILAHVIAIVLMLELTSDKHAAYRRTILLVMSGVILAFAFAIVFELAPDYGALKHDV